MSSDSYGDQIKIDGVVIENDVNKEDENTNTNLTRMKIN